MIVLAVDLQDALRELAILAVVGGLAAQAMKEGGIAALLQTLKQATHLTRRDPQQPRRLHWAALPFENRTQDTQTIALPLAQGYPVSFVGRCRRKSSLIGTRRTFLSR